MAYPIQRYTQLIVLKLIHESGETFDPVTTSAPELMADFFKLSDLERTYISSEGINRWATRVEHCVKQLVSQEQMEIVDGGMWRLRPRGVRRLEARYENELPGEIVLNVAAEPVAQVIEPEPPLEPEPQPKVVEIILPQTEEVAVIEEIIEEPPTHSEPESPELPSDILAPDESFEEETLDHETYQPELVLSTEPEIPLENCADKLGLECDLPTETELTDFIHSYLENEKLLIISKPEIVHIIQCLKSSHCVIMIGKLGCGKTSVMKGIVDGWCKAIDNKGFNNYPLTLNSKFSETDLFGYVASNGQYVPTDFARTFLYDTRVGGEPKFFFLTIEEMLRTSPDRYFNQFLGYLSNHQPIILPNGQQRVPPVNFMVMGTLDLSDHQEILEHLGPKMCGVVSLVSLGDPLEPLCQPSSGSANQRLLDEVLGKLTRQLKSEAQPGSYWNVDRNEMPLDRLTSTIKAALLLLIQRLGGSVETRLTLGKIKLMLEYLLYSPMEPELAFDYFMRDHLLTQFVVDSQLSQKLASVFTQDKFPLCANRIKSLTQQFHAGQQAAVPPRGGNYS